MIMQRKVSNIAFHSISANLGQKKTNPKLLRSMSSSWTFQTVNQRWERLGLDCPLLVAFFFTLSISLTPLLDDSRGKKEGREVWEEAEAILIVKTTPLKYHGKGSKTAVSSVLCGSALSFPVRHYWSNNILVFGALFTYSCCSILYSFLLPLQWLITLVINASDWGKKKNKSMSNFEEMQVYVHLDTCVIHSKYIWRLNDYWCSYVWIMVK